MALIVVTAPGPGQGKTTAATAIGLAAYYRGLRTGVLRLGDRPAAESDATYFADLPFAAPPSGRTATPAELADRSSRFDTGILVVEADVPATAFELARSLGGGVVLVASGANAVETLRRPTAEAGDLLRGVVMSAVPQREAATARNAANDAGWPVIALLPEDRTLHAPSIADVARATGAEVLLGEAREDVIAEHVVVAPVSADPAYLHFQRYPHKLVIARSDKTELQISAVTTSTNALLLTGGIMPGSYTFDRLSNERIPLLLAPGETVEVIGQIEGTFAGARFHGPRKLERLEELTMGALDLAPLRLPAPAPA